MDSDSETEPPQIVDSCEVNKSNSDDNAEDDDELFSKSKIQKKKRGNQILDSDEENEPLSNDKQSHSSESDSDSKDKSNVKKFISSKKRIINTFDSDSDEASNSPNKLDKASNKLSDDSELSQKSDTNEQDVTNYTPSARIKERNYKFENKFKSMLKKVNKLPESSEKSNDEQTNDIVIEKKNLSNNLYDSESDDDADDSQNKMDIEDERLIEYDDMEHEKLKSKKKKVNPQPDQPKVQRMSAKQAMEQMHKIKSESGRMLREKQVSLPYHKPKQMSLKDILAKRKNASTSLNSRFGFKMNSDQLKEYVKELENREKEILELCKSESEEEEEEENCDEKGGKEENQTGSEKNNDEKTAKENNKEFVSLQNACKNLLDMFDKNDTSNEPNNDTTKIVEKSSDNLENADKVVPDDKETVSTDAMELNEENKQDCSQVNGEMNDDKIESTEGHDNLESAPVLEINDAKNVTDDGNEVPAVLSENNPGVEKLPESEQLFDDSEMDCDFTIDKNLQNIIPSLSEDKEEPTQLTADLVIKQNPQPRLTGSPGCFIDLISGEVNSGVELLKKKFMYHSAIKTPEELEREKERKVLPGSALQKLKRDLENKIIENRTQEWTKRLEGLAQKKMEENDNLSDCEELLEKEECSKMLDDNEMKSDAESCEDEEEPIENDVDLTKEKKRKKCDLLDEEADVDDEENIVSADEKETDKDDSDDSDSSDDSGDDLTTNTESKKTLTRIIKPCDDSDSEDEVVSDAVTNGNTDSSFKQSNNESDVFENAKPDEYLTTPVKETKLKRLDNSDLFDSQSESRNNSFSCEWDELPLGQKIVQSGITPTPKFNKNISDTKLSNSTSNTSGRSDLASLVSPVIKLAAIPRTSSDNMHGEEFASPHKYNFEYDEKIMNLQKKLLFDSEGSQCTQNLQDLESLCSGKFPSQEAEITSSGTSNKPADLDKLIDQETNLTNETDQLTQDTENELLELCTGKFVGINDTQSMATHPVDDSQNMVLSLSETENTEKLNEYMENILQAGKNIESDNLENINNDIIEKSRISDSVELNEPKEILTSDKNIPEITVCNRGGKMAILSSEDEDTEGETIGKDKSKILKSTKDRNQKFKKKMHLQFSDDESEQEEEDAISGEEYAESEEEKLVDYDSEENEIEVKPLHTNVKPGEKKKTSEFFDQEAELTSEDEWVGSGDEDERGLDKLEWEEGDADQFDQREVKKELERIHLRTILDDDKREVRMLQEILLEDDMEGGTRERKFRWRNVDSTVEPGATVGEEDIDTQGLADMQTEEEWRKQRHERETFLRQMLEKENSIEQFSQNSESGSVIMTTKFVRQSSIIVGKGSGDLEEKEGLLKNKKGNKELPSPVKKPFSLLKNNIRGSFLSRGQAALNRLAMLTKNAPQPQEEGEPTNLSSLAPGKKKNFVFATVSPPCDKNELTEEVKILKRKAASEISTPLLIKKTKLIEQKIITSRKSLIDHID